MQWASVIGRTAILPCEARPRAPTTHYLLPSSLFSLLILDYSTLLYVVRTVPWFFAVAIPFFRGCGGLPSSFCPSRIF